MLVLVAKGAARDSAPGFAMAIEPARDFAIGFALQVATGSALQVAKDFAIDMAIDFDKEFAMRLVQNIDSAQGLARNFAPVPAMPETNSAIDTVHNFAEGSRWTQLSKDSGIHRIEPLPSVWSELLKVSMR